MLQQCLVSMCVVALLLGCEESPEPDVADLTAFTGARLIDGTGGPVLEDAVLVVRGDRIETVGAAGSMEVPSDARVIDVAGRTIMPPMINLHGHLARTIDLDPSVEHFTEANVRAKLDQYARYGVLHVLSIGVDQPLVFDVRAAQRAGEFPGARVYTAGRGFGVEGGYPPLLPDEGPGQGAHRLTDPDEAREAVRELASEDVDFVKMWVDHQFEQMPALEPEIYEAVIDEAQQAGLPTGVHIFTLENAHRLLDVGVTGLLHSVRDEPVDAALIDKLRDQNAFYVATLVREEAMFIYADRAPYLDDPFFTAHHPPSVIEELGSPESQAERRALPTLDRWEPALRMAQENLVTLHEAGVRIGFGSDSGPPARFEGYFEHRELELMVEAGLTPAQVIEIASRISAEILGIDGDYGTIESGKMAEFLILAEDPSQDISNTKTLEEVWQNGVRIH